MIPGLGMSYTAARGTTTSSASVRFTSFIIRSFRRLSDAHAILLSLSQVKTPRHTASRISFVRTRRDRIQLRAQHSQRHRPPTATFPRSRHTILTCCHRCPTPTRLMPARTSFQNQTSHPTWNRRTTTITTTVTTTSGSLRCRTSPRTWMLMWKPAPRKTVTVTVEAVKAEAETGVVISSRQLEPCPWRAEMRRHGCLSAGLPTARGPQCGMHITARARDRRLRVRQHAGCPVGVQAGRRRRNLGMPTLGGKRTSTTFSSNEFGFLDSRMHILGVIGCCLLCYSLCCERIGFGSLRL